ncbi:MAG: signal peptidase II [Anaerolineales bacterium]|nr:signal peptidase II [Anaerolineales bacterium]MCK5634488.1 signal peptidase II [Anaerolineales bacterium]
MKRSLLRDYGSLIGVAGVIIALDQWTKYLVRTYLSVGESWVPFDWLRPYARIVHWNNTGAAFGIFPSGGAIFSVIAVLVIAAILYYFPQVPRRQMAIRLALGLQLGGAAGNLLSRLFHGVVTDFVSLGNFAVFNVADSCISIGAVLLIWAMWLEERRNKQQAGGDPVEENGSRNLEGHSG